jgi:hypothetical protein
MLSGSNASGCASIIMFMHLNWFYDIFIGVVTGVRRCGSFVRGGFDLLFVSYG